MCYASKVQNKENSVVISTTSYRILATRIKWHVSLTSDQRILMKGCITFRAVIEESMMPFAAYTTADSHCFSMGRTTPKIAPFRWRDLEPM